MERRSKRKRQEEGVTEENFELKFIDTYIGNGFFVKEYIPKGLQLLEYMGKLRSCSPSDGEEDETYKYYFHNNGKKMYIDATYTKGLGRMVNDSAKPNCKVKKIMTDKPRLWLYSIKDIHPGEQLTFDYGVKDAPWRKRKKDEVKPVLYKKPSTLGDIVPGGSDTADKTPTVEGCPDVESPLEATTDPFPTDGDLIRKSSESGVGDIVIVPGSSDITADKTPTVEGCLDAESPVEATTDPFPTDGDLLCKSSDSGVGDIVPGGSDTADKTPTVKGGPDAKSPLEATTDPFPTDGDLICKFSESCVGDIVIVPGSSDITADKTPTVEGCLDAESPVEATTDPFPTDGDLLRKSSDSGVRDIVPGGSDTADKTPSVEGCPDVESPLEVTTDPFPTDGDLIRKSSESGVGDIVIVPGSSDITADKTPTVEGCLDAESPVEATTDPFPTDGDLLRKSSDSGVRDIVPGGSDTADKTPSVEGCPNVESPLEVTTDPFPTDGDLIRKSSESGVGDIVIVPGSSDITADKTPTVEGCLDAESPVEATTDPFPTDGDLLRKSSDSGVRDIVPGGSDTADKTPSVEGCPDVESPLEVTTDPFPTDGDLIRKSSESGVGDIVIVPGSSDITADKTPTVEGCLDAESPVEATTDPFPTDGDLLRKSSDSGVGDIVPGGSDTADKTPTVEGCPNVESPLEVTTDPFPTDGDLIRKSSESGVGDIVIVPGSSDITADKTPTVEGCLDAESPVEVTTDPFLTDGDLLRKSSDSGGHVNDDDLMTEEYDDDMVDPDYLPESDASHVSDSDDSAVYEVFPSLNVPSKSTPTKFCNKASRKEGGGVNKQNQPSTSKGSKCKLDTGVTVNKTNNTEEKRVWDKYHYCIYCETKSTNIMKHYYGPHRDEEEVKKILDLPLKSEKRKDEILRLRNAGDFIHNTKVLKEGKGHLVTMSRPSDDAYYAEDFLPCEWCLGFFLKTNLWRHQKVCPLKQSDKSHKHVQARAYLLLPSPTNISIALKEKVVSRMAPDEISIAARCDTTIIRIGEKLFQKHSNQSHLYHHVSQKMRELGRFLICARENDEEVHSLADVLKPKNFPLAVKTARILCNFNEQTNTFGNPSLALKLGHLLKKCASVAKSAALVDGDRQQSKDGEDFLTLVEAEWTDAISSSALQTLASLKMNKGELLPLSEDLAKLQSYFKHKSGEFAEKLEKSFSKSEWDLLNQITLAQLVMFNRRRGGETQRITISSYQQKKKASQCAPKEIEESLTATEKVLLSTMSRIEIRGKKGRTVPVLLTPAIERNVDILLKQRSLTSVNESNIYLFPRSNHNSIEPIRSADVLRRFAKEAELQCPENVTSTKLRKHVATVSQILNLSKHDLDVMAGFLGHDISVHRSFYRLPQETIQVARMGRLLTAFNNGTVGQYSGRSIDDIRLDEPDDTLSSDEDAETSSDEDIESPTLPENHTENTGFEESYSCTGPSETKRARLMDKTGQSKFSTESEEGSRKSFRGPQTGRKIQHLSSEQKCLLRKLFQANITLKKELKMADCVRAINAHDCLSSLSWTKIKNTVHNWITLEKRKFRQS